MDTISQRKEIRNAVKELLEDETKMKIELTLEKPKKFHDKCPGKLCRNKCILALQKKIVPCHFKNWLLRRTGMKVGHDACIPHDITFDPYFPELIFIGKGALIGGESNLITHKVEGNKLILGKNILGERVMMAGLCEMHPGSKMSETSMLNLNSALYDIIPEGELWSGKPAALMSKLDDETIKKFFANSTNDPNYYKDMRQKLKELWKDPNNTYLKVNYNGNRLTAGDDWWRARNIFAIYWSGGLVELARMVPGSGSCGSGLRKLLFRLAGAKIGKNVYIGKGCVFDNLMTPSITVGNNVRMEDHCYIDGHEYTTTQTVFGKTKICDGAHLKSHVFVRTGTLIVENSVIESDSMAQRVIPPNEVWSGYPAKFVRKVGEDAASVTSASAPAISPVKEQPEVKATEVKAAAAPVNPKTLAKKTPSKASPAKKTIHKTAQVKKAKHLKKSKGRR